MSLNLCLYQNEELYPSKRAGCLAEMYRTLGRRLGLLGQVDGSLRNSGQIKARAYLQIDGRSDPTIL